MKPMTRDKILTQIPEHLRAQCQHVPPSDTIDGKDKLEQLANWIGIPTSQLIQILTGQIGPYDMDEPLLAKLIRFIWTPERAESYLKTALKVQ